MATTSTDSAPSQTGLASRTSIGPMDDLDIDTTCPSCGYPGLEHDIEFDALVHDHCGYWRDL